MPKRKAGTKPLPQIHGAAQPVQQLQISAVSTRIDDARRQAKLYQDRKQKPGYYEFNSCLRSKIGGCSIFFIQSKQ